ncbi:MAG: AraC family transcriptional regulator, partial [Candidatus Riflebacteria bacterium GWC2_50_8]
MPQKPIRIVVVNYPGALQSAVAGFQEMFLLAGRVSSEHRHIRSFSVEVLTVEAINRLLNGNNVASENNRISAVILPPSIEPAVYACEDKALLDWISGQHSNGTIVCSVCAGVFILAASGLLQNRIVTTHWGLGDKFSQSFPQIRTDTRKILIDDGDIITAGGLMAWVDLGLHLVARFAGPALMRQLSKFMVVDSGLREQSYYQSFYPRLDHGCSDILKVQHFIQKNFSRQITVTMLSELSCLTERTFLRRFCKATGLKPTQYLQKVRIQKACDLAETTDYSFDVVASKVGYEDISAFRKVFWKTV